jgi:D-methionine transport system substrate-binding protein
MNRRTTAAVLLCAVMALVVSACGLRLSVDRVQPLRVAATPGVGEELLAYVERTGADALGLSMDVVRFDTASAARRAVRERRVDVAFVPGTPTGGNAPTPGLTFVAPVVLEPYGLYSARVTSVDELQAGGEILVPDEPEARGRALRLLADQEILRLREGTATPISLRDITANPRQLRLGAATSSALLDRSATVAAVVLDARTVRASGLVDRLHVLGLERGVGSGYAHGLVVRAGDDLDPRVATLGRLLRAPSVRKLIADRYHPTVVPAF